MDSNGSNLTAKDYYAFGMTFNQGRSASDHNQRYRFTGREEYSVNPYLYYRTRDYSSIVGRFTIRDKIIYDGNPDGNLYNYVIANPIIYNDPMGEFIWLCAKPTPIPPMPTPRPIPLFPRFNIPPRGIGYPGNIDPPKITSYPPRPAPRNVPRPPGYNKGWDWGHGERGKDPRYFDPNGEEWRLHRPDKHHKKEHWDYNPHTRYDSPWQNINLQVQAIAEYERAKNDTGWWQRLKNWLFGPPKPPDGCTNLA